MNLLYLDAFGTWMQAFEHDGSCLYIACGHDGCCLETPSGLDAIMAVSAN